MKPNRLRIIRNIEITKICSALSLEFLELLLVSFGDTKENYREIRNTNSAGIRKHLKGSRFMFYNI